MTDLTMTTDLRAAVEQRREERRRSEEEAERRQHDIAMAAAEKRLGEFIVELYRYPKAVNALALFGLCPEHARIEPTTCIVCLKGVASLGGHRMTVLIATKSSGIVPYTNIRCTCEAMNWEHEYRGHMVNTLADDLLAAADELLALIEQESA